MLPVVKRNRDGSLTIYIGKDSPGKAKEGNRLPAPGMGPIHMVMGLYRLKESPPSVLPPVAGDLDPPV
jgi:hypothetical protein